MLGWLIGVLLGIEGFRRESQTTDDRLGAWSGGSPATWACTDGGWMPRELPPS